MTRTQRFRLLAAGLALLALVCSVTLINVSSPRTAKASGTFTVSGTQILDPNGNPFLIKGVNINGPNWVWPIEMTQYADLIGSGAWNFNFVRVNAVLKGTNFSDNNDTDKIVNAFTSRGIVVMFEAHDWTGSYPSGSDLTLLTNWDQTLAAKYKNNPYVWFDAFNEPGDCSTPVDPQWLAAHQAVVSAIRDGAGANNIIVAEDNGWAQGLACSQESSILKYGPSLLNFNGKTYGNIAFNTHIYCGWNKDDGSGMGSYFDQIAAKNLAVFVGEFGISGGSNCDATPSVNLMYNVIVPRNIGRVVWHWYGGDGNTLTNTPNPSGGWKIDSTTNPTNLTYLGQLVWNDTHNTLTLPPTPTPQPTATPTQPGTGLGLNVDDSVIGTGLDQFNYVGNNWGHCTQCDNSNYGTGNSWDDTAGEYVTMTFSGTKIEFYGVTDSHHGIGAISIDGGPVSNVDFYAPNRAGNQLLWTSPVLLPGTHVLKLVDTGTKNPASADAYINVDRVNITTTATPLSAIHPILECVVNHGAGKYTAYFGYQNDNNFTVEIVPGSGNSFYPAPQDRGQPAIFQPGRTPYYPNAAFSVDFNGSNLVWNLNGRTSTASSYSRIC